jgi:hypothetical protein
LASSPASLGAPHSGLAADRRRMRARTSLATGGRVHGSLADGELVPEGEDLELHRGSGANTRAEKREAGTKDRSHEASDPC